MVRVLVPSSNHTLVLHGSDERVELCCHGVSDVHLNGFISDRGGPGQRVAVQVPVDAVAACNARAQDVALRLRRLREQAVCDRAAQQSALQRARGEARRARASLLAGQLMCTAALWVYPLAAHRSVSVCARKLA